MTLIWRSDNAPEGDWRAEARGQDIAFQARMSAAVEAGLERPPRDGVSVDASPPNVTTCRVVAPAVTSGASSPLASVHRCVASCILPDDIDDVDPEPEENLTCPGP